MTQTQAFLNRLILELYTIMRFGLVGVVAAITHLSVAWLLLTITSLSALLSNMFAFLTAFGVSFAGHYLWTFKKSGMMGRAARNFFMIAFGGFVANTWVLSVLLDQGWFSPFACITIAILIIPAMTFLGSRLWGFK